MSYQIGRRQFIQAGMASLAMGIGGISVSATEQDKLKIKQFYKVFYDRQSSLTDGFVEQAKLAAQRTEAVDSDVTSLWFDDLYHYWRANSNPMPIAGLTTETTAYCLDVLARDAGLRTVFRGIHKPMSESEFSHSICSPEYGVKSSWAGAADWSANLYHLIASHSATQSNVIPLDYAPGLSTNSGKGEALLSWVISPVRRNV